MNFINKILHNRFISIWLRPLYLDFYRYFIVPFMYPKRRQQLSKFIIENKLLTAKHLVKSTASFGRYGNGELRWMLGNEMNNFEENSPLLKKRLSEIIKVNDKNYMVGLPDAFISINQFNKRAKKIWGKFVVKYSLSIIPYLNKDTYYYDANTVRPYIDYHNRSYAIKIFHIIKQLWTDKNILIVEGAKTRLGVGNNLFNNAKAIKRIECPVTNAFESYNKILSSVIKFLRNDSDKYITLLSLGPTATVLSYDLYKKGYRAVDIGHIDSEYMWCLMNAKKPINIPYKYTNEANIKDPTKSLHDKKYYREIIDRI